jgi:hypothetical protein
VNAAGLGNVRGTARMQIGSSSGNSVGGGDISSDGRVRLEAVQLYTRAFLTSELVGRECQGGFKVAQSRSPSNDKMRRSCVLLLLGRCAQGGV